MTAIISKNGELLFTIQANFEILALNIPPDGFAVDDPPQSNMYYSNGWVNIPSKPTPHHEFNYATKQWIDERSIETAQEQKWNEIKAQRDTLEFGGFEFESNIYDSDLTSQSRILGAANAALPQTWTLQDNSTINLNADQLNGLYVALQTHIAQAHERGRIARQLIYAAETIEQVEAVNL